MLLSMVRTSEGAALSGVLLVGVVGLGAVVAFFADEGRAPAGVLDASASDGGRELRLTVDTCQGSTEATVVSEGPTEVVVEVISDVQTGEGPACLDAVTVRLRDPLGDRDLVDTTGARIWVPHRQRR
jgi:hypothetical protein